MKRESVYAYGDRWPGVGLQCGWLTVVVRREALRLEVATGAEMSVEWRPNRVPALGGGIVYRTLHRRAPEWGGWLYDGPPADLVGCSLIQLLPDAELEEGLLPDHRPRVPGDRL